MKTSDELMQMIADIIPPGATVQFAANGQAGPMLMIPTMITTGDRGVQQRHVMYVYVAIDEFSVGDSEQFALGWTAAIESLLTQIAEANKPRLVPSREAEKAPDAV